MDTTRTRLNSRTILEGRDRAPARSYLKGMGFTDEDLNKPIVGVAHSWIETMPCNYNHRRLAERVKDGVREAGGTPMELNTVAISDGITMGTQGMKTSLVSREVMADSIELVGRGHMFDAIVTIVGCDKTLPAAAMAHVRLNIPSLIVYSGSIAPGRFKGHDVTIQDVFEGVGANAAGKMSDEDLLELETHACPGAGACGGQFTANTMAMALEFLGLSPFGSASPPAVDGRKDRDCVAAGKLVMHLLERGLSPDRILTRASFENAIAGGAGSGGSTNLVLHLLAIAREAGHSARHRRLRPGQRAHPDHRRPQARRALHGGRPRPRGRDASSSASTCWTRGSSMAISSRFAGRPSPRRSPTPRRTRGRTSSPPSSTRCARRAGS